MIEKKTQYGPLYATGAWGDTRDAALRLDIEYLSGRKTRRPQQAMREALDHECRREMWVTESGRRYSDRTDAVRDAVTTLSREDIVSRRAEIIGLLESLGDT